MHQLVPRRKRIRIVPLEGGRWSVDAGVLAGGRRGRTVCSSLEEAQAKAREYEEYHRESHKRGQNLSAHELQCSAMALQELKAAGLGPEMLVKAAAVFVKHHKRRGPQLSPLVEDLAERLQQHWRREKRAAAYVRNRGCIVRRIARDFRGRAVGSILGHEVESWLDRIEGKHSTRATHRAAFSGLLSQAMAEGLLDINPVQKLRKRTNPERNKAVAYLDAGMWAYMLWVALEKKEHDILLCWLLQGYAGARHDEVAKPNGVAYEDLYLHETAEDSFVRYRDNVAAKRGGARDCPLAPNAHAWFKHLAAGKKGPIARANFRRREKALRKLMAPVIGRWEQGWVNSMRHSYGTYRIPMILGMSYDILSREMGNSPHVARTNYDGNLPGHNQAARQKLAQDWWSLTPANVRDYAQRWLQTKGIDLDAAT